MCEKCLSSHLTYPGRPENVVLAKLRREAEAMRAVSDVNGFPNFYGIVDVEPRRSLVMEFFGDYKSFNSYTLWDVLRGKGPRLTRYQLVKVRIKLKIIVNISLMNYYHDYMHSPNHTLKATKAVEI